MHNLTLLALLVINQQPEARPCRADAFYIDVPLHLEPSWVDTEFLAAFDFELEVLAPAWFCSPGELCPAPPIDVETRSVLAERSGATFRGDGHLRFFQTRFTDANGAQLAVPPDAQCAVV